MAMSIGREIAELRQMNVRGLREKYEAVFGEPTRAGNKDFLFKRIAWRIQSLAEGDLSERARRRAELLARDADLRTTAPRTPLATVGANGAKPAASLGDERVPPPGKELRSGEAPPSPPAGWMIKATFGYAHYDAQGQLVVGWINEMVEQEACTS